MSKGKKIPANGMKETSDVVFDNGAPKPVPARL